MILNSIEKPIESIATERIMTVTNRLFFYTTICGLILILLAAKEAPYLDYNYTFENNILNSKIKTFQMEKEGEIPSYPTFLLNSNDKMLFSFDDLSTYDDDYYYKLIHCSHGWEESDLEPNEYIAGFNNLSIDEIEPSFNSSIPYVHYEFEFPNEMMKPTLSGNYLLVIYPEYDEENPIITCRIIVYEELVRFRFRVKESSVVRERNYDQEVDFDMVYNGYDVPRPYEDIHQTILQNFNWTNAIDNLSPIYVKNDELTYDYGEENTFDGNNEFRFVSLVSLNSINHKVDSVHINSTDMVPEFYLKTEESKAFKLYTSNPDINGDFKIDSQLGFNDKVEAEYCRVYFSLKKDIPFENGKDVYIYSKASMNTCMDAFKMHYNYKKKLYEAEVLMKQGYYNYLYCVKEGDEIDFTFLEGSHFQTENDFHLISYDSNPNLGYDRVIGLYQSNTFNE